MLFQLRKNQKKPKSNCVSVGLYFYPPDVVEKVKNLKPSNRKELEITDLNNLYLKEKCLSAIQINHKSFWSDVGTHESLLETGLFIKTTGKHQNLKIAYIEGIAYRCRFINNEQMISLINELNDGNYKTYLKKIYEKYCKNLYFNNF